MGREGVADPKLEMLPLSAYVIAGDGSLFYDLIDCFAVLYIYGLSYQFNKALSVMNWHG